MLRFAYSTLKILRAGASEPRDRAHNRGLRFAVPVALISLLATAGLATKTRSHTGYVAHEWGTFTSVEAGDGTLLQWKPLESSRLPGFVYDWFKPGLARLPAGQLAFTKAELLTLQRMETPVIYFYANDPVSVDATVKFPKGLITEWYPQTDRIGPAVTQPPRLAVTLDKYVQKAGLKLGFTFSSLLSTRAAMPESGARWAHVHVLGTSSQDASHLPAALSGSHYFAARETDANLLEVATATTNSAPERERFLFYRGVGNFETPLKVSSGTDRSVVLKNDSKEILSDLYLVTQHSGSGAFTFVRSLFPGEQRTVPENSAKSLLPTKEMSTKLEAQIERSLVEHGLYDREAAAMVHTWKDSWFEEDGIRVLYLLPRSWTDRTLPLTLNPEPRELRRVMVGRAELLVPEAEQRLAQELTRAADGDAPAQTQLLADLKKLNRFAEPALRLATEGAEPAVKQKAWEFLSLAQAPDPASAASHR